MAKVIDTTNYGGQLVVLGDALVLPSTENPGSVQIHGSIRYNPTEDRVECLLDTGGWSSMTDSHNVGAVVLFAVTTPEDGYALANGAQMSRTGVGARLFAKIGTTHGVGNGTTTFTLPLLASPDSKFSYQVKL